MTYEAGMRGGDLKRASALTMSAMGPQMMANGAIRNYEASAEVGQVSELPNGHVSAEVTFREYGRLDLSALAGAMGEGDAPAAAPPEGLEPVVFTSTAHCKFRLALREGEIVIVLAACRTDTTM